jgi:hypothetical protein
MKTSIFTFLLTFLFVFGCSAQQFELVKKEIKEENKKLNYSINVSYSIIKDAVSAGQKGFNKLAEEKIKSELDNFKKEMDNWETYNKEMASVYEFHDTVFYLSDKLISVRFDGFQYYSGAAHPLTFFFTLNYDFTQEKEIDLNDIFSEGYLKVLSDECIKDLKKKQSEYTDNPDIAWITEGAGPKEENFKIFNFTKTFFLVTFPIYQVAPYVAGPTEVNLSYTPLLAYIKTNGSLGSIVNE